MSKLRFIPIVGLLLLGACASPAEIKNMVVDQSAVVSASKTDLKGAIVLEKVSGGEDTNPLWTSEVSNEGFQGALQGSLEKSGLLAKTKEDAKFNLSASLFSLDQPLFGLDLTVKSKVKYAVTERTDAKVIFDEAVDSSYTATFGDSPIAIQRLRFANEGAIRENIKQFITRLLSSFSANK